ncbi:hypothetical protein TNIN_271231 [Trichonephila inaurata madagascariensis]|uniref:Uncharacterized protein n=1 Tax=Trichonephila inaurata madagascariensis TaxID=2747483 RepID=A0A8X6XVH5_9ARAC|nr:hypothetical protein TNIN_271231 [Trichonephila inaurata madagascariensis]
MDPLLFPHELKFDVGLKRFRLRTLSSFSHSLTYVKSKVSFLHNLCDMSSGHFHMRQQVDSLQEVHSEVGSTTVALLPLKPIMSLIYNSDSPHKK